MTHATSVPRASGFVLVAKWRVIPDLIGLRPVARSPLGRYTGVYRLAAIFWEADYSGQILNAERKCLPTVSCSETNMCDPAVSKAVSREFDGRKRCL